MVPPKVITFCISIRPRAVQTGTRAGVSKYGRAFIYSNTDKKAYIREVALFSKKYAPEEKLTGPLLVEIAFLMPRLKSAKDDFPTPCDVAPDLDNLEKGTLDGLSKAGFWVNDSQICEKYTRKYRHELGGHPRIVVLIKQIL